MAARTVKIRHTEEIRAKIQASQLVNRLRDHVLGEVELSQTQIRAAEILLKKALPDLSSVELSGELTVGDLASLPDAQLAAIATRGRSGALDIEAAVDPSKLN